MNKELRILQANMKKSKEVQHALHNDTALEDFHFILGQEPSCFLADDQVVLPGTNPRWTRFTAQGRQSSRVPIRSCIWASKELAITQLRADSADITAVMAHIGRRRLIVISVYIPDLYARRTKEENLEELSNRLEIISRLIKKEQQYDPHTEVVITGDFNRHNPLWGGSRINTTASQEESAPIIELMTELSLQSLLPAGVITFTSDAGRSSTIDLILTSSEIADELAKCAIWEHEYGSDH
jgi:exonuclease III